MGGTASQLQRDFDRIALLPKDPCDHNARYHGFLVRTLPPRLETALDLGCGTGEFSRLLARRAAHVLGVDLSPNMVRVARERSVGLLNVEFHVADVADWAFPPDSFDCIAAIATLHHLPMEAMLTRMRSALRPGGTLLILDLFDSSGVVQVLPNALALAVDRLIRLLRTGRLRPPSEALQAWAEHGRRDKYPRLAQVRAACREHLPGARVRRHVLWRYSVVWRKSVTSRDPRSVQPLPRPPEFLRRRYNSLARWYVLFEWILWLPWGIRERTVRLLELRRGQRVLEVGCGTGRNLRYLQAALGPEGHIYGVDLSEGMLDRCRALCDRNGWTNVTLARADALDYTVPVPLDAALFSLSYGTMLHRVRILHRAWSQLRPGGRLVILEGKLPPGFRGRLLRALVVPLMKATVLGDPDHGACEDLAALTKEVRVEESFFGGYVICRGTKPLA